MNHTNRLEQADRVGISWFLNLPPDHRLDALADMRELFCFACGRQSCGCAITSEKTIDNLNASLDDLRVRTQAAFDARGKAEGAQRLAENAAAKARGRSDTLGKDLCRHPFGRA